LLSATIAVSTIVVSKLQVAILTSLQYGLKFAVSLQEQSQEGTLKTAWSYLNREIKVESLGLTIYPVSILLGLIVLVVTVVLARSVSALLQRRTTTFLQLDPGIRYTIARLVNYFIITVGVLIALKLAFKIDLTTIAVVFTALSVGIGFGLQYIAADIASGFILLFERPIRIGDRITIDQDEGDVESINLRTTIVVTNDRISVIVPNSRLVSQRVINWSYGDPQARIAIPVGVAYNSDVQLVTKTLIEAAKGVENVLDDPEPRVQFLQFGDFSLDFRLLVWSRQPRRHRQIKSDINYRIESLFRERGIEIPYPVQDLRVSGLAFKADQAASLRSDDAIDKGSKEKETD